MPSLNRDATTLILLQPLVTPRSNDEATGGQVAGARGDQNTFLIDGGDATSNTDGNGAYNTGFVGEPRAVVPTPAESLEEFQVATNNQNATFSRSAGGQVNMITRRATNELHGSAYWFHQNDNLNANLWSRNRLGQEDPELKDNRYGFTLGGPIIKGKTFIFGHFEERRFPQAGERLRLVPTDTFKQGILRFRDASGNVVSYDLARIIHEGASRGQERGVRVAVCERDRRATSLRDFWCWILVRAQFYTELRWIEEKSWPWSGGGRWL